MIRVMPVGLGPIGAMAARQIASRKGFRLVGAVDVDPRKTGRDLGDYAEFNAFAQKLELAQKAACPECVATKGLARQQSSVLFGKVRAGDATALEVLKQRAEAGDAEAQFMMARLHSWGSPLVQSDERQAVAWVRKAADQGHAEAQSNLAFFHVSGRGLDAFVAGGPVGYAAGLSSTAYPRDSILRLSLAATASGSSSRRV